AAGLRDGRSTAAAAARRTPPARDPRHVRLQERQVGSADRADPRDRRGLLGAEWVRRQRLGRQGERSMTILRFTRTERAFHWVHAAAFLTMLGSGLVLYVPALAVLVNRRPLVKDVHVYTAVAWLAALGLILVVGDRRAVLRDL